MLCKQYTHTAFAVADKGSHKTCNRYGREEGPMQCQNIVHWPYEDKLNLISYIHSCTACHATNDINAVRFASTWEKYVTVIKKLMMCEKQLKMREKMFSALSFFT